MKESTKQILATTKLLMDARRKVGELADDSDALLRLGIAEIDELARTSAKHTVGEGINLLPELLLAIARLQVMEESNDLMEQHLGD